MRRIEGHISKQQGAAMKLAEACGEVVACEFPEILDAYKIGKTGRELAMEYGEEIQRIADVYKIGGMGGKLSSATERSVVMCAVKNLTDPVEKKKIGREHMKKAGKDARDAGLGIFGRSEEEQKVARSKGLETQREKHIGFVFTTDYEKRREMGRHRALMQGKVLISDKERALVDKLSHNPDYQHATGGNAKQLDSAAISSAIKAELGITRSTLSIRTMTYRLRKAEAAAANLEPQQLILSSNSGTLPS